MRYKSDTNLFKESMLLLLSSFEISINCKTGKTTSDSGQTSGLWKVSQCHRSEKLCLLVRTSACQTKLQCSLWHSTLRLWTWLFMLHKVPRGSNLFWRVVVLFGRCFGSLTKVYKSSTNRGSHAGQAGILQQRDVSYPVKNNMHSQVFLLDSTSKLVIAPGTAATNASD